MFSRRPSAPLTRPLQPGFFAGDLHCFFRQGAADRMIHPDVAGAAQLVEGHLGGVRLHPGVAEGHPADHLPHLLVILFAHPAVTRLVMRLEMDDHLQLAQVGHDGGGGAAPDGVDADALGRQIGVAAGQLPVALRLLQEAMIFAIFSMAFTPSHLAPQWFALPSTSIS